MKCSHVARTLDASLPGIMSVLGYPMSGDSLTWAVSRTRALFTNVSYGGSKHTHVPPYVQSRHCRASKVVPRSTLAPYFSYLLLSRCVLAGVIYWVLSQYYTLHLWAPGSISIGRLSFGSRPCWPVSLS